MIPLDSEEMRSLLAPFHPGPTPMLLVQLGTYLDLLLRWNLRTNLTAIRDPAEIVQRHFGECLLAASLLDGVSTLLDYGSGAGFPGIPIALVRPDIQVTLAESQNKKSSFLREVIRSLQLSAEVWPGRVGDLPQGRRFDCVALRAVDRMGDALVGASLVATSQLIILSSALAIQPVSKVEGFEEERRIPIPGSRDRVVLQMRRGTVPRGT